MHATEAFREIADRVWLARRTWYDVNVTAIGGDDGLVVVDTHASGQAAGEIIADLELLGAGPVTDVVNTHAHLDHVLGNHRFAQRFPGVRLHAHEDAAAATTPADLAALETPEELAHPRWAEVRRTPVLAAERTFSGVAVIDLGDRQVEVLHLGRGHTAGDAVVRVADADLLVAGDLVEESGPPAYGPDCFPLEWPDTLDLAISLLAATSTLVPGHGAVVDREFVIDQRDRIGAVAETLRDLAGRGIGPDAALAAAEWPYPPACLGDAVARGYAHLPRGSRRLPLI